MKFQAYLITCLATGRGYVGITSRGIRRRWNEHLYSARKRPGVGAVNRAIAKHGDGAFTIRVIAEAASWEELCKLEPFLIGRFKTRAPHGYNLSDGGEGPFGCKRDPESVERSAAKHRGRPCHPNTRLASSLFHTGRPKSIETRKRIADALTGIKRSAETRLKISTATTGKSRNIGVCNGGAKLTPDKVHEARSRLSSGESQNSIALLFGVHRNTIWKIAHGLKWKATV
jgi:Pseudomonas phage homing endonuclease